jgi:hypothetical protein
MAPYNSRKHGARAQVSRPLRLLAQSRLAAACNDPTAATRLIRRVSNGAPILRAAVIAALALRKS